MLGTALKDPPVLCRKCGPEKLTYLTMAEVNLFGKHSSRIGFRSKILVKNLKHHLVTKFEGKNLPPASLYEVAKSEPYVNG